MDKSIVKAIEKKAASKPTAELYKEIKNKHLKFLIRRLIIKEWVEDTVQLNNE
jgi:hypothetical protein